MIVIIFLSVFVLVTVLQIILDVKTLHFYDKLEYSFYVTCVVTGVLYISDLLSRGVISVH